MNHVIEPHIFCKTVRVPPSKSHTIRRVLLASFTEGLSVIERPLDSLDAKSCIEVCGRLGADIEQVTRNGNLESLRVKGTVEPHSATVDVGNSGTTLFLALAMASLGKEPVTFVGDEQIQRRSASNLLAALGQLGVQTNSAEGCTPITVQGPWRGGKCVIECPTSQYLSALLFAAPLTPVCTEIEVPLLNEKPYVQMTLAYLDNQGLAYEKSPDLSYFKIKGGFSYRPINGPVAGDFSSAAFPALAAVLSGGSVELQGLDPNDTQGDKAFFDLLKQMGCNVYWEHGSLFVSREGELRGCEFDLNAVPDTLPALAVVGAIAQGKTVLYNVAHARKKETDRVAVMAEELGKLGIRCEEKPDGLVIHGGTLRGGKVRGQGDHRVVMALAAAALGAEGPVSIEGTEAAAVTYPGFIDMVL